MQSLVQLGTPLVWAKGTYKCFPELHSELEIVFFLEGCDSVEIALFTFHMVCTVTICITHDQSIMLRTSLKCIYCIAHLTIILTQANNKIGIYPCVWDKATIKLSGCITHP